MTLPKLAVFASHMEAVTGDHGERLVEMARVIEAAGADQFVLSEHVVLARDIEAHGPGGGTFPFPSDHNYPEPMVTLAAVAGATERLRLATGILIAPMRPATLLAKMASTLDVLSAGRLDLGVGAGWHGPELRSAGADPSDAMQRMDDIVGACRALWAGGPSSYRSPTVNFDDLYCEPAPVSGAALPVWFAGPCIRSTFRRIVRLGDGWLPFGNVPLDGIARGRAMLDQAAADAGCDPAAFGIRASLPLDGATAWARLNHALAAAPDFVAAGANVLQLPLSRLATTLDEVHDVVATAAAALA